MAEMSSAAINDLPDSAFAYIEPGGSKDDEGKTVPRSLRHFPIHDAAHVRNALARAPQSPFGDKAMPKIRAAAKKFGIDVADETSRSAYDESLHPHAPKGSSIGGQFVAKGSSGSSSSKTKSKSNDPPPETEVGPGKSQHNGHGPHVDIPKGSYGYDPASNHGTGYGMPHGDPHVHKLQQELNRLGFTDMHGRKLTDDGKLGPLTTSAVIKAKRALGIKPADGIVNPAFISKLAAMKKAPTSGHQMSRSQTEDEVDEVVEQPTQIPMTYRRTYELEGIEILSRAKGYGDGRTVEAYAAVFNVPQEIHDQHGDYIESNDPVAFNAVINSGAAMRALVLYNHGFDARGKSGGLPTLPLGHPIEVKADKRGLLTVSRYNEGDFADGVLASIRNGDIRAQSYEGPIYRSNPTGRPGKARYGQPLPKVRRMEMGLRNYGPTPTPYYEGAEITAIRSVAELAEDFARLDADGRDELIRALSNTPGWDPETAHILASPHRGPGADDPQEQSLRQKKIRLRAELLARRL